MHSYANTHYLKLKAGRDDLKESINVLTVITTVHLDLEEYVSPLLIVNITLSHALEVAPLLSKYSQKYILKKKKIK